jgi:dienelactone hydrolase
VFDDRETAFRHRDQLGIPEIIRRAEAAIEAREASVFAGLSMGASLAQLFAATHPALAAILIHGVSGLDELGIERWPSSVPVAIHYSIDDSFVDTDTVKRFERDVRRSGGSLEIHAYAGSTHLFTDADHADFDAVASEQLWSHVSRFLNDLDAGRL